MQVTVDDITSVKKTLHIEIPEKDVLRELDKAYQDLRKTAKIKGFRPGKVPRSVLESRFKKEVNADVLSRLIQESLISAIKEKDLKVVGNPQLDPPELTGKGPYQYSATVELNPDVPEIDFKGLSLKKHMYEVSDTEIETQLKLLQKNLGKLEPIEEERPVQTDDYVTINYEGFENGQPIPELQKTDGFTLQIGKGMITSDFDDQLVGMTAGQNREVTVSFPDDYYNKRIAGRTVDFQVSLVDIRKEEIPPIDDVMAKKAGEYKNLDELKAEITSNLKSGYDKRAEQEINEQVFEALLERVDFEVPDAMVEAELNAIVSDAERSFAYHQTSMEEAGITQESLREKYRETALKQVRRHLILGKIIEQEDLELPDDDLEAGYADMAKRVGQGADEIRSYYQQNPEQHEFFKHTLLEKGAMKLIIESSEINEIAPEASDDTAEADSAQSD
ncbi:Cell division trigger factor (EC [Olavius algarvensis associated proteobacterium Delta 3]|nr:Cell division trigger factor (EC [Olavius algarvensis associated proteobacterium Delta 3]CAB5165148.1 Cell division trigger factor (EC [Olavius algarvensis associated proteobacterium Delta 3]